LDRKTDINIEDKEYVIARDTSDLDFVNHLAVSSEADEEHSGRQKRSLT